MQVSQKTSQCWKLEHTPAREANLDRRLASRAVGSGVNDVTWACDLDVQLGDVHIVDRVGKAVKEANDHACGFSGGPRVARTGLEQHSALLGCELSRPDFDEHREHT